ncbi:hypothetical protein [Elizabethkingia anophelis]|uniref:hypothetical protein n=1 Tax=Elizabethkingia anophelis TaxID=1117645 RepID=UPI003891BD10
MKQKKDLKKEYMPPSMEVTFVEMEEGIASGSATVQVNSTQPNEQWEKEDQTGQLDW